MTPLQQTDDRQASHLSPAEARLWRQRWEQASAVDRRLRAERIRAIDWDNDWPWIDGLLRIGVAFAKPRLPTSLIEYRRRLAEKYSS